MNQKLLLIALSIATIFPTLSQAQESPNKALPSRKPCTIHFTQKNPESKSYKLNGERFSKNQLQSLTQFCYISISEQTIEEKVEEFRIKLQKQAGE
jgi:hypothetical protein